MNRCLQYIVIGMSVCLLFGIKIGYGQSSMDPISSLSLEDQFQATRLDAQQLEAFEERGLQKISDWMDYEVMMLSDTVEEQWQTYISKKSSELFLSDSLQINASQLLKDMTSNEQTPSKIEMLEAYQRIDQAYRGQAIVSILSRSGTQTQHLLVELILSKQAKDFGGEKLWLWKVLIGEVKVD